MSFEMHEDTLHDDGTETSAAIMRLHMLELQYALEAGYLNAQARLDASAAVAQLRAAILRKPDLSFADLIAKLRTGQDDPEAAGAENRKRPMIRPLSESAFAAALTQNNLMPLPECFRASVATARDNITPAPASASESIDDIIGADPRPTTMIKSGHAMLDMAIALEVPTMLPANRNPHGASARYFSDHHDASGDTDSTQENVRRMEPSTDAHLQNNDSTQIQRQNSEVEHCIAPSHQPHVEKHAQQRIEPDTTDTAVTSAKRGRRKNDSDPVFPHAALPMGFLALKPLPATLWMLACACIIALVLIR